jgi:excisionase family DNA binding protein
MIAVASPDKEWITIAEAVKLAGCTEGYIRRLLIAEDSRLTGWKAGERAWLVKRADVVALKASLSTRSVGRRAERPATPKPKRKRKPQ